MHVACRVSPIAAPDQPSPAKTFLPRTSIWKGIVLGYFSHTPRWLYQVLKGASRQGGLLPPAGRAWELQRRPLGNQVPSQTVCRSLGRTSWCTALRRAPCRQGWPWPGSGPQGPSDWPTAGSMVVLGLPVVASPASPPPSG